MTPSTIPAATTTREPPAAGRIRRDNERVILAAAEAEFAQHGYKGATTAAIARRAGLPKANVHYYFGTKHDLYTRVLGNIVDLWLSAFAAISPEDDPAEALGAYIRAKVMYSKSRPLASRLFAQEVLRGAPHIKTYLATELRLWVERKAGVLRAWAAQGRMDPVDPVHLIFMIWAVTQHYADFDAQVLAVMDRESLDDADYERVADSVTAIILKGCGITTGKG